MKVKNENVISIDLGCGKRKIEGSIGVDKINLPGVDIVHDCENGLPFEDNYADEIFSFDFIEHIHRDKVINLMNEIWRVLKPSGKFKFKIPDAEKGQGAFQDITHRSLWVRNSFKYYENRYYHDMYGIKAKFKIGALESIRYETEYWGENYALMGHLIAEKDSITPVLTTLEASVETETSNRLPTMSPRPYQITPNRIFTTDDLCPSNLKYFEYWDRVKQKYPQLKLIAFTIARKGDREEEDVSKNEEFKKWYEAHKDWVEIGVHGYDHLRPQEGWRQDQEEYIKKALDIIRPYLPTRFLYRAPGFRTLPKTEGILKKLGFAGIAHQEFIKYFDGEVAGNLLNTHCTNEFANPITEIWSHIELP